MKKPCNFRYLIFSSFIIFLLASIIHNLYDITGLEFVKPFAPVNESVWEHMKMIFYAGFVWSIIEYFIGFRNNTNFIAAKSLSIILMTILVPMFFYTYTAFTGTHILWVDLLITFISALIGQIYACKIMCSNKDLSKFNIIFILIFLAFVFMFAYFTYNPPESEIFTSH